MNWKWICVCGLGVLLLSNCGDKKEPCKYGTPQSIFSPDLEKVVSHNFTSSKQNATETIVFQNEMELTIFQSGCDSIRQVFQTTFNEDLSGEAPEYFIEMAIQSFHYLGSVSSEYFSLNSLGETIQDRFHDIKLGKALELQPNYFIKIDKITSNDQTLLIVELMSNN